MNQNIFIRRLAIAYGVLAQDRENWLSDCATAKNATTTPAFIGSHSVMVEDARSISPSPEFPKIPAESSLDMAAMSREKRRARKRVRISSLFLKRWETRKRGEREHRCWGRECAETNFAL
jgi:hypothetical protein